VVWIELDVVYTTSLGTFVWFWKLRLNELRRMHSRIENNEFLSDGIAGPYEEGSQVLGVFETKESSELSMDETKRKLEALDRNAQFTAKAERIVAWGEELKSLDPEKELRLKYFDDPRITPDAVIAAYLGLSEGSVKRHKWQRAQFGYNPPIARELIGLPEDPNSDRMIQNSLWPPHQKQLNEVMDEGAQGRLNSEDGTSLQSLQQPGRALSEGTEAKDKDTTIALLQNKVLDQRKKLRYAQIPSEQDVKIKVELHRMKNGKINYSKVGREYGVSHHTAKKWCERYRIK
jgi:hypothetical protein